MSELDAVLVASSYGGTIFGYLAEGERFTFTPPSSQEVFGAHWKPVVYTKGKRGWYRDASGRKFRTGSRTAVFRIKERA